MLDRIGRDHDVGDVDGTVERASDACVDYVGHSEVIGECLHAECGVDLAHTTPDDDCAGPAERPGKEVHVRPTADLHVSELAFQMGQLAVHRADDTQPHACCPG